MAASAPTATNARLKATPNAMSLPKQTKCRENAKRNPMQMANERNKQHARKARMVVMPPVQTHVVENQRTITRRI